jgi:pilus assembly protein CpaC
METRQIVVDDGKTTELGRIVKQMVNPSLRVEEFGGTTVIDGVLDSPAELARLRQLTANENVTILARLDPRVFPAVAQNITAALQRAGLKNAYASVVGQTIVLEGSVADEREMQKAQLIADGYAGELLRR